MWSFWSNRIKIALLCAFWCGGGLLNADSVRGAERSSPCHLSLGPSIRRAFYPAKIRPYRIRGRNAAQIALFIKHNGPYDHHRRSRYAGYYRWFVSKGGDIFKHRSFVELPCLRLVHPAIRLRWRQYLEVLARHELNHHRLFLAGISEFQLLAANNTEGYWQRTVASMRARDREWDALDVVPPFDRF